MENLKKYLATLQHHVFFGLFFFFFLNFVLFENKQNDDLLFDVA